jgi:hypothetical protein
MPGPKNWDGLTVNGPNLETLCKRRPQRLWPKVGGVYFAETEGLVKIGLSAHIAFRLEDLRCACPFEITLLHFERGYERRDERRLHRQFDEYRVRGEWFRCEGELLSFLVDRGAYLPPRFWPTKRQRLAVVL